MNKPALINALLEIREIVLSGSAEMAIIDEVLIKETDETPWKLPKRAFKNAGNNTVRLSK